MKNGILSKRCVSCGRELYYYLTPEEVEDYKNGKFNVEKFIKRVPEFMERHNCKLNKKGV